MSRSWVKLGLVALSLSALVPAYAWADGPRDGQGEDRKGGEKKFPMDGAAFKQRVETRLARWKERITNMLERRDVPAEKRAEVMKDFEAGAAKVRAAADAAAKDGTVTVEEAKDVRKVAKEVRRAAREKYGHGKGKGEKGKGGKGKKHHDEDRDEDRDD